MSKNTDECGRSPTEILDWVKRFLVSSSRASDASELAAAVGKAVPEAVRLGYTAVFFLNQASQQLTLRVESARLLRAAGLTVIQPNRTDQVREWPCRLSELFENSSTAGNEDDGIGDAVGNILCQPIKSDDEIAGIICFGPLIDEPAGCEGQLVELAAAQAGLALRRISKEREIKEALSCQIDEMVEIERRILSENRQSCMAEMALGMADGVRNPITVIGGLLRRISKELDVEENLRKDWAIILKEMDRLERLIKDFERFARKRELVFAPQDMREILKQTVALVKEDLLPEKEARIVLDLAEGPCIVRMDRKLMGASLTHLILNAVEAVGEEGVVKVSLRSGRRRIVVEVADDGEGIRPVDLARIFDPFFTTKQGGTGLGLTYTQQIVAEHRGEIKVSSAVNQGTVFSLTLPEAEADSRKKKADD